MFVLVLTPISQHSVDQAVGRSTDESKFLRLAVSTQNEERLQYIEPHNYAYSKEGFLMCSKLFKTKVPYQLFRGTEIN